MPFLPTFVLKRTQEGATMSTTTATTTAPTTALHQSMTATEREAVSAWARANRRYARPLSIAERNRLQVESELAQLAGALRRFWASPSRTLGPEDRDLIVNVVDRVLVGMYLAEHGEP